MFRAFLTVGGWTMASRVLGLVRDQLLAILIGVGAMQDAYQVAFRLPNMFRRLFGEGAFNAAFVPMFSSILHRDGLPTAQRFANEALGVLSFWLLALTVLGEVFMPQVVWVIGSGFARRPEVFDLAVTLSRITFPYMLLICAAALVSGVLNGLDRYAAAAAAYVLFNVVGIAAILWLTPHVPSVAHAAAWGVTISGVVQLGALLWAARRAGLHFSLPRPRMTPEMRVLMRRIAPGLVGSGVTQLNLVVDTIVATWMPAGSVSLIYFADRVNQLPLGVLGAAAGTSMLPLLSRQIQAGEIDAAHRTQGRAIEYALVLTLPAALALIALAAPIMATLFGYGKFTTLDAVLSAQSLCAYAVGLPFFVLVKVLGPGFFARGDTATPVRLGMITLALNFALNLALYRPLAHVGPPLASSLASMINVLLLAGTLGRRGQLRADRALISRLARMALAAMVMTAVLVAAQHGPLAHVEAQRPLRRAVELGLLIVVGMGVYGGMLHALGVVSAAEAWRGLSGRLRRRRAS
ncbi:putative peptidoglycan lipid II flippase [Endobacter medicaginis]|uniref:Probable lipid II flippase MurJ n=3 Tax=Endobacter medicaginis TaxID=1181271 RepID=A0A839V0M4_9PROT|nr:murein biosynthesis integral membrane protein MurJ [Endobacter medicaginis]MBB3174395.1 putative peptidoglycan lipid II flippase [Endobacter medicaginis]MCX5475320.1 murein biosynthesis integral membrane protein MurJ [Endobacter medicaginis]